MALTRKQAWRRVRVVRHEAGTVEAGKTKTDAAARRKRPAGDWMRQAADRQPQQQQQQQQHGSPQRHPSPVNRTDRSDSSSSSSSSSGGPASPERNVLDNWRLPREGRDPSARPGVSAARRQAAAACVRVGSRVSFNTVVAAILIPSAKDLHAAAREELWWQETDYRDFRINFIQFMRTPPAAAADGPELVAVEIVAESESTPGEEEDEETAAAQESVQQPVVVDPAVYEGARATEKVCAWPVQDEEEEDDVPEDAVVPATVAAAAAAAAATAVVVVSASEPKKSMSSFSLSDSDDTSPPTPPSSEEPVTDGGESDESIETAAGITCAPTIPACAASAASPETPPPSSSPAMPAPAPRNDPGAAGFSTRDGEGDDCPTAGAAAAEAVSTNGGDWDEQETNRRGRADSSTCSLGWSSVDDEGNDADEEKEEPDDDDDGNTIRMGRSFSNLETARRGGAGLSAIVAGGDSSDGDESSDDSELGARGGRPRALSLDGWFTCGLENGVDTKTYETHDHAGRLRDLVLLAPIPAVCATPPTDSIPNQQVELNDALRRLGVAFNVSVDKSEAPKAAVDAGTGTGGGPKDGETKRRAEGDNAVSAAEGGFCSSPAAAAAARKMAALPSPIRPRPTAASVKSQKQQQQQQRVGLDRSSSLTTPVGFRVS